MKDIRVAIAVVVAVIFISLVFTTWPSRQQEQNVVPEAVACTLDAKICPDGSAVGRVPPTCEFSPCPSVSPDAAGWQTFTDPGDEFSFQYPLSLDTSYMSAQEWPPTVVVATGTFVCNNGGSINEPSGSTTLRVVGNQTYCVQAQAEGAAGSVYTTYHYTTMLNSNLVTVNFVWRTVQCANYDEPAQSACEKEHTTFDLNNLVNQIVSTITVK